MAESRSNLRRRQLLVLYLSAALAGALLLGLAAVGVDQSQEPGEPEEPLNLSSVPAGAAGPTATPFRLPTPKPAAASTALPTPVPIASAAPAPKATPFAGSVDVTALDCGTAVPDLPLYPGALIDPEASQALAEVLAERGFVGARRAGWTVDSEKISGVLDARVVESWADPYALYQFYRRTLAAGGWALTVDLPESHFVKSYCVATSIAVSFGAFQANDLDPVQVDAPGYILAVYSTLVRDFREKR